MSSPRTTGLEVVIYYKFFIAGLLAAISLALFSTVYSSSKLDTLNDAGLFELHFWLVDQGLDQVLKWDQKTVQFWGIITGLYALLIFVQALGLRFNQTWAKGLVLITTGIGLPIEVYELAHEFTRSKLLVFTINLIIFSYFWQHLKLHHRWQRNRESDR
ncbi:MAG: DUF2127 domain-containing protein [Phormidesmis sp. CAN_BIN44]|nr:DUF2127 domain-containing protein [Phormidesmis sp. CAN_BIN44]